MSDDGGQFHATQLHHVVDDANLVDVLLSVLAHVAARLAWLYGGENSVSR